MALKNPSRLVKIPNMLKTKKKANLLHSCTLHTIVNTITTSYLKSAI